MKIIIIVINNNACNDNKITERVRKHMETLRLADAAPLR